MISSAFVLPVIWNLVSPLSYRSHSQHLNQKADYTCHDMCFTQFDKTMNVYVGAQADPMQGLKNQVNQKLKNIVLHAKASAKLNLCN